MISMFAGTRASSTHPEVESRGDIDDAELPLSRLTSPLDETVGCDAAVGKSVEASCVGSEKSSWTRKGFLFEWTRIDSLLDKNQLKHFSRMSSPLVYGEVGHVDRCSRVYQIYWAEKRSERQWPRWWRLAVIHRILPLITECSKRIHVLEKVH